MSVILNWGKDTDPLIFSDDITGISSADNQTFNLISRYRQGQDRAIRLCEPLISYRIISFETRVWKPQLKTFNVQLELAFRDYNTDFIL